MKSIDDLNKLLWINEGVEKKISPGDCQWKGDLISTNIPPVFDRYLKIFHGIFQKDTHERIFWKDLAMEENLNFHKEFNEYSFGNCFPDNYFISDEGSLDTDSYENIISILTKYSKDKSCYFFYNRAANLTGESILFEGSLSEVKDFDNWKSFDFLFCNTPTYIWPEDKSWILNTDPQLYFTLFGCNSTIYKELVENEHIESMAVDVKTRIDTYSDSKNFIIN